MRRIPSLRSLGAARLTVALLGIVLAAFVGRFVWDDVVSAADIPRGVVVDGVAIGNTDRAVAATRLEALALSREVTLTFAGDARTQTLTDWGVILDVEATLDAAAATRGSFPGRVLRWAAAVVTDRTVAPVWTVDRDRLESQFGPDALDIAIEVSAIELVDGAFDAVDTTEIPIADVDALESALLDAADDETVTSIEVPSGGVEKVVGDPALAEAANRLTAGSIEIRLAGQLETRVIESATLRDWLEVAGETDEADLTFDPDRVQASLAEIYPTVGVDGVDGVKFAIGFDARPYVLGALPGSECCADDSAQRLIDAVRGGGDEVVVIFPVEGTDEEGLRWAEGLGIRELVGEFTTRFAPGQTRNINIARIAELTRGAVIEPGETFSVNDYVGPRTTDKGFVSAGVISNGVFTTSVGGGVSQYATTLFNAAFFAGLEFGEYQSHSIYIDRYPYGREATVSFPAPDLQIVNSTPYGVLIWPTTTGDSVTVKLYSTKWVQGEQSGQTERTEGTSCTRVTTERTRTWIEDGRTETDTVTARYRPEGVNCDGSSSQPDPPAPSTSIPTTVP